jgi:hypothetical protein
LGHANPETLTILLLTFTGGTGEFANVSGMLTGGGNIYPTYYTTSGEGALTGPGLVAIPEPTALFLFVTGMAVFCFGVSGRAVIRSFAFSPLIDAIRSEITYHRQHVD